MEQLRPLIQHAENYYQGLERAISKNPDQGVQIKRKYDLQMQQAFDQDALNLYNAYEHGNLASYVKDHKLSSKDQNRLFEQLSAYNRLLNGDVK